MTLTAPQSTTCPHCGHVEQHERYRSVNLDREPALREQLLDGALGVVHCSNCNEAALTEPELLVQDLRRRQWIAAWPRDAVERWPDFEAEAMRGFAVGFGENAPALAKEIGALLQPRVVFGWSALREKLVVRDADLDDVRVEQAKLLIFRHAGVPPDCVLRLVEVQPTVDAELVFVVEDADGQLADSLTAPRSLLDEIEGADDAWTDLLAQLRAGAFVDMQRLFRGSSTSAEA